MSRALRPAATLPHKEQTLCSSFVTLTLDQLTISPAELQSAMTEFVENELQTGGFVITGGLASHADGARVELSPSGVVQGGAHLPIHGFAVVEAPLLEQAVEVASPSRITPGRRRRRLDLSRNESKGSRANVRPGNLKWLPARSQEPSRLIGSEDFSRTAPSMVWRSGARPSLASLFGHALFERRNPMPADRSTMLGPCSKFDSPCECQMMTALQLSDPPH